MLYTRWVCSRQQGMETLVSIVMPMATSCPTLHSFSSFPSLVLNGKHSLLVSNMGQMGNLGFMSNGMILALQKSPVLQKWNWLMCKISLIWGGGRSTSFNFTIRYKSQYANIHWFEILHTKVQPVFSTGFVLEEFTGAGIGWRTIPRVEKKECGKGTCQFCISLCLENLLCAKYQGRRDVAATQHSS